MEWPAIIAVWVIALCALVGTAIFVNRSIYCTGSKLRFALRAFTAGVAIFLCALLVIASVVMYANRNLGWVKNVHDIVGIVLPDTEKNIEVVGQSTLVSASNENATLPARLNPRPGDKDDFQLKSEKNNNNVWRGKIVGADSGLTREVTMWVPDTFDPSSTNPVNVVIFEHGFPGTDRGPLAGLDIAHTLGEKIHNGELPPTIFVVPNIAVDGQPNCVDIRGQAAVETFVTSDVPRVLRAAFPQLTPYVKGWMLAGISSGGYCAPVLALRHQDTFYGAISLGGYDEPQLGLLSHADAVTRADFTVSVLAKRANPEGVHMFIGASENDADARELAGNILAALENDSGIYVDTADQGGHGWATWKRQMDRAFSWWALHIKDDKATQSAQSNADSLLTSSHIPAFELRGWALISLACALAAAAYVGILIGMKKRAYSAVNHLGGKKYSLFSAFFLVLVAAFCVALAICVIDNRAEVYFSTWADLAHNWQWLFWQS